MKYSLPDSSTDLLIKDGRHLMRSLSVYEVLRRFSHILRLTPFRYEDFSAALLSNEQSALFAEIHIQLLKTLVREDRIQQTWLGPQDIRDSINIYLYSADHICWPAALRVYLTADPYTNADLLDDLHPEGPKNYPFNVGLGTRLDVLEDLCEKFLLSVLARDDIVNGNQQSSKQDTLCKICSKANGEFIYCQNCPSIFHPACITTPTYNPLEEEGLYLCTLCRSNHVRGVTDCISIEEKNGNLKRHEPIGVDKAGRTYWFIARRLFVVDELEEDIRYYSTRDQLQSLIDSLKESRAEKIITNSLLEQQEEFERQMKITEALYEERKDKFGENCNLNNYLGEDDTHKNYINHYWSTSATSGKNQHPDKDVIRTLSNKFSLYSITTFRWNGNVDGDISTLISTIKSTILRLEASIPTTFIHHCWPAQKQNWIKSVNGSKEPKELTGLLSFLETGIKPVLFRSFWQEGIGFTQLLRSTSIEREELKKTDKQARGFERRECVSQDFEIAYRMGTVVKFSPKLKPVKHQVWKQKGEEYRLTGLNGWYWRSRTHLSRPIPEPKLLRTEPYRYTSSTTNHPFFVDMVHEIISSSEVINVAENLSCDEYKRYLYPKKPLLDARRQKKIAKLESLLGVKQNEIKKPTTLPQNQLNCDKNINGSEANNNQTAASKISTSGSTLNNQTVKKPETPLLNITTNGQPSIQAGDSKPSIMFNTNRLSTPGTTKLNFIANTVAPLGNNNLPKKCVFAQPKLPPKHNYLTKRGNMMSLLVLPDLELHRLARSGGLREAKSFSYSAKQSQYIWPYGITPRPTFRTCWLYRNCLVDSFQDVALQLKVMHASIRWEDLQVKPPVSGQNIITTDESIITVELLKKRDKLPYLMHSEYLVRKVTKPIEQPTKYRKVGTKKSTPSARIGLRARRSVEEDDNKGPTTEETWVSEDQLELWELRQFDERIERHNQLMRERAMREEAERRRKLEEERRRKAELERRRQRAEEEAARRARLSASSAAPEAKSTPKSVNTINIPNNNQAKQQDGTQPISPAVVRYLRTEQGQIIRLPASYLERGTPLILRQVGPSGTQTNTYIIRPQVLTSPTSNLTLRMNTPLPTISQPTTTETKPQNTSADDKKPETAPVPAPEPAPKSDQERPQPSIQGEETKQQTDVVSSTNSNNTAASETTAVAAPHVANES